jgi:(S)-ureidoglycine aminohydrolase
MDVFGATRSRVCRNYALITPDTHVVSPLIGWERASAVIHIGPELGARFLQYTAILQPGGRSNVPGPGVERMVYVLEGEIALDCPSLPSASGKALKTGAYAYFPADAEHTLTATTSSRLVVFEKIYRPLASAKLANVVVGREEDVPGQPFMGDPDARLKTLLPIEPAFDMAVNLFTYQPGAILPQVEIHVMEHGLLMLDGAGVYRLGDDYYPVTAGDVIWLASFCPQWFVAMGKRPARYIYYKDVHRDGLWSAVA